jgi:hypothetical protein
MEWVATHLGNTMNVERTYNRVMSSTIEKAKIAKILLLVENGEVNQFLGKKLDEIDFDGKYRTSLFISILFNILTLIDAI